MESSSLYMLKKLSSVSAISVLIFVCLVSFLFMLSASRGDSAITDELAHIPAGYGYVHNLDYRLNPEHPPLIKALAMLPVLLLQPNFPTQASAWQSEVNSQWAMGALFLYQSGNDANAIVRVARIMPIFITILAVIFIYIFARRIMGKWWALLPATLFALDPSVIAHGHYVTTDVGAALGVVIALYYFLRFIESPTTKALWAAGIAFGIAQATKFSTPLLVPLFIFLILVLWLRNLLLEWRSTDAASRFTIFLRRLGRYAGRLALIFVIGYGVIVYPLYFIFTAHYPMQKQTSDTAAILGSFAGGPTAPGAMCRGTRCLADVDIWMTKNPVTRPLAQYMLGVLMVLQRADGGNTIYFLGAVRSSGGWIYFPVLFLLKEPIPTLIIIFFGLGLAVAWMIKAGIRGRGGIGRRILDYIGAYFAEFSMTSFIVLYWGYSMRSPLNIGIRHLLPTVPLIYILAAGVWKKWIAGIAMPNVSTDLATMIASAQNFARRIAWSAGKYVLLILLVVWLFLETIFAAPHFLSYFNEFGGGVYGGYRYVTDSNYDWGQDLLRLKQWVDDQNAQCALEESATPCGVSSIAVDYFGGGNPHYMLGNIETDWSSSKGNPADQGIHWFAVSINQLQGGTEPLAPGQTRKPEDSYPWLTALRPPTPGMGNVPPPDARVGTSIFIYHL